MKLVLHTVTFLALLGAYVGLTIAGHDGTLLLGLLGGQAVGAGIEQGAARAKSA